MATKYVTETLHSAMLRAGDVNHAIQDKDFQKAHDLRDKLFSYLILEISTEIDRYTKRDIEELLAVLVGVDDWGI